MKQVLKNPFIWLVMLPSMVLTGCTSSVFGDKETRLAGVTYDVHIKPGNVSYGTHSTAVFPMVSPMRSHGTAAPMVTGGAVRSYAHHSHAMMPKSSAHGAAVPSGKGLYTTSTATMYSVGSGGSAGGGGSVGGSTGGSSSSRGIRYGGGGAVSMPVLALATTSSSASSASSAPSATAMQVSSMSAPSRRGIGPRRAKPTEDGTDDGETAPDSDDPTVTWTWSEDDLTWYSSIPNGTTRYNSEKGYMEKWDEAGGEWVPVANQADPSTGVPIGDIPWIWITLLALGYGVAKLKKSLEYIHLKRQFFTTLYIGAMLMPCTRMYAYSGATCSDAIPLGKEFEEYISKPQTIWYSAWTFDLPLAVYFMPQNESDPAPEVEMDFSCVSGVYSDSILNSLFSPSSGSGIQVDMPHKPKLQTGEVDGKFVYWIKMGKDYRDLLLKMGISYNVEVFVKVTYKSVGTISIAPDDMFSSCMDGTKFMQFGDTVRVKANDKDRFVVVPYVQWQEDSIYYIWSGSKKAEVTVATDCKHNPDAEAMDESVLQRLKIPAGDTVKVTSDRIKHYVQFGEAGMLFAKCVSSSDGVLTIKRVPQAPPRGGATALRYGKQTVIKANDTTSLYAIPHTWDTATVITTPTDHIFRMYIGTEPDFYTKDAIATYQFLPSDKGHWLGLFTEEMKALWTNTKEHYLYVRFACSERATILPEIWHPSECLNKELVTRNTGSIKVQKASYGAVFYRFYYNDWRRGDLIFRWNQKTNNCPTFVGDTCFFSASASDPHVYANKTIPKNGSWTITAEELESWANHADPDGYFYVRFNSGNPGEMDISTTAPAETDPELPHATIHVACANDDPHTLLVTVSEPQTITVTANGTTVDQWEATPGTPHTLNLSSGQYTLTGAKEEVLLLVP